MSKINKMSRRQFAKTAVAGAAVAAAGSFAPITKIYGADPIELNHWSVEFQNRKKPVASYRICDITVGYVGFEVSNLDTLLANAKTAGARVVSSGGGVQLKTGERAVLIRDPDVGGFVELIESPPTSR